MRQAQRSQPSVKGRPMWFMAGTDRPLVPATAPATGGRQRRHVRARRSYRMAHPSAGSDADRHLRLCWAQREAANREIRPGNVVGSTRREALARRVTDDGDDTHRHQRSARRKAVD